MQIEFFDITYLLDEGKGFQIIRGLSQTINNNQSETILLP